MVPNPSQSLLAYILLKLVRRLRLAVVALATIASCHIVLTAQFARVFALLKQLWFFAELEAPLCLKLFYRSTDCFFTGKVDGS